MPTESENIQFLYLVVTHGGSATLDYNAIAADLNLSNGATSKRWQRLRDAIDTGKNPGPSAYEFLWLAVKHSARDKAPNWKEIAELCDTTAGAASKRYSRMKKAFDDGVPAPGSASKSKKSTAGTAPSSPVKIPVATPKRKRGGAASSAGGDTGSNTSSAPSTKKNKTPKPAIVNEQKYTSSPSAATATANDIEGEEEGTPSKKAKRTPRPKAIPRPKIKSKAAVGIKQEEEHEHKHENGNLLLIEPTTVLGIPPPRSQAIHHKPKPNGNTNTNDTANADPRSASTEYHSAQEFASETEK